MTENDDKNDLSLDDAPDVRQVHSKELRSVILRKSRRRERARRDGNDSVLTWFGTFGLVGWTVMVPTLAGLALGRFLDGHFDRSLSFTITFLLLGTGVGISMAWYWVVQESQGPTKNDPPDDE